MRYKINYGPDDKRDRWGHTIKKAVVFTQYFDSHIEAEEVAVQISREHKKWTVCIYDTQGPQDDPEDPRSTLWLMKSYKKGILVFENYEYYKALNKK